MPLPVRESKPPQNQPAEFMQDLVEFHISRIRIIDYDADDPDPPLLRIAQRLLLNILKSSLNTLSSSY